MSSHDRSHKDGKYFVSYDTYNCPFCNRRNVKFTIEDVGSFNWDVKRLVHYYRIECSDCRRISFHLSNYHIQNSGGTFDMPLKSSSLVKKAVATATESPWKRVVAELKDSDGSPMELDELFFFHQPTSFFTVDTRIPTSIREPLSEAENCLKNNFLTGASAGLRKAIYKLLKHEEIPIEDGSGSYLAYDDRIKLLAKKHATIEQDLFHDLEDIQGLTSQELHENDWEDFDSKTLRFLLEVTRNLLEEVYVMPEERKQRRQKVIDLKKSAKPQRDKK